MKCSLPLAAGLCFAMLACNNASPYNEEAKDSTSDIYTTDTTVYHNGSSLAAVQNKRDTVHKFVRTADIKFKVNNVEKTTYQIEDAIRSHGGFITLTQLQSHTDEVNTIAVSEDSAAETTRYTVTNNMTFRVPNTALDTTLKDIARLVDYLDYRVIKADDVSLQLYAGRLAQNRSDKHAGRLMQSIDKGSKKLDDITAAEGTAEEKEAARDEAAVSQMLLNDQVNFSTVQLAPYQRQGIKTVMVANTKALPEYEPSFGAKLMLALGSGLKIVEAVFIGLVHLWPVLLLVVAAFFTYKKYGRKV